MKEKRCVVTGLGLICAVGETVPDCWEAVTHGVSGIRDVRSVDTEGCYATKGAEVSADNKALSEEDYDRSSLLCIKAASEALQDSGYMLNEEDRTRVGVVLGSCVGGAASIENYYAARIHGENADPAEIYKMPASAMANNVAEHFDLQGTTANIVNACAAGTLSIAYACDQIRSGKADAFVAGGSDVFSSLAFAGFHALHALDENSCSPFNHSKGITLGEGAGVLIVESYEHAVRRGAKIYCEVLGSGVSSDAHHITAPRPDGQGQMSAIRRAMENSGITPAEVDYINAHGTGTAKNDEAEFLSLHTLFDGNDHLSVSSTKSMTGHCLGAAGSIEAVFTVKAVCENLVPPTIGYSEEDLETLKEKAGSIDFVPNKSREKEIHYAMSNSFAFGGNNASIIFTDREHEIPVHDNEEAIYVTGIGAVAGTEGEDGKGFRAALGSDDYKKHGIKMGFYRKLDWFSQLQLISGVEALEDAQITVDESNEGQIGIIIGTADGPMTEIAGFQSKIIEEGTDKGSAFSFPNTVYNAAGGYLSIFTGIKGYNVTVANGTQAGLQSVCYGADVLRNGEADIMLTTGTDENTDTDFSLYDAMGLCRDTAPYSLADRGFRLGEGSVTMILEKASSAEKRGRKPYAKLAGSAEAHQSVRFGTLKGSEEAMKRAIRAACAQAGIDPAELDGVCAFANGHQDVDSLELSVYRDLLKEGTPLFCVKETMGEARAAASAMQAAYAAQLLSGQAGEKAQACLLGQDQLEKAEVETAELRNIAAVAFGTGGSYSAVVLQKI